MVKEKEEGEQNIKARIERALNSRLQHFRDNASSFTLASIRRLLEEDLGLEKYAVDVHKSFIKQFIEKNLNGDDNSDSKKLEENVGKEVNSSVEVTEGPKKHEMENDLGGVSPKDEAKLEEDSPIMGVLTTKTELASSQAVEISESMIKKAISERADYIKSQSETLTLAGARRFLEEDLKLSKNALDPFKKFIRKQVEEVLNTDDVLTSAINTKKKNLGNRQSKAAESATSEGRSDSVEHIAKSKEKVVRRVEAKKLGTDKKRKKPEKKTDVHKQSKLAKKESGENSDADNERGVSEDGESQSSEEKPVKKKAASTPTFGKNVERLKSIIKACGMSIAPTVYKKAKQVPDSRREAFLIKELEGILSKEGLSKNPSEKEIKEVRKRKERAKELEGIDMSNIITSSRRRSTMSFVPPPKPTRKDEGGDSATNTSKNKDTRIDDKKKEPKQEQKDEEGEEPKQEQKEDEGEEPKEGQKEEEDEEPKQEQKEEEEAEEEEEKVDEEDEEEEEEEEEEDDSENEEFNEDDVDSD